MKEEFYVANMNNFATKNLYMNKKLFKAVTKVSEIS